MPSFVPVASGTLNLVGDPQFKSLTAWWAATGNTAIETTADTKAGGTRLAITSTSYRYVAKNVGLCAPGTYYADVWVKSSAGATNTSGAGIKIENTGSNLLTYVLPARTTDTPAWTLVRVKVVLATSASPTLVVTNTYGGTATGTWYFSGASFIAGDPARSYFDGSTAGHIWVGTPHASVSMPEPRYYGGGLTLTGQPPYVLDAYQSEIAKENWVRAGVLTQTA